MTICLPSFLIFTIRRYSKQKNRLTGQLISIYDIMITASKLCPHVVLACKWGQEFLARTYMSRQWDPQRPVNVGSGPTEAERRAEAPRIVNGGQPE